MTGDFNKEDYDIEDVVRYSPNTIVIHCRSFDEFEDSIKRAVNHPNWHPYAHLILFYDAAVNEELVARLFFILWYHMASRPVILHYQNENFHISYFNPYISQKFKLNYSYGCWTVKNVDKPLGSYVESFACEKECHNVTLKSKRRRKNMGTCIGYSTHEVPVGAPNLLRQLELFQDIGRDLHAFTFSAFVADVGPFTRVSVLPDGTNRFHSRDGIIWNELARLLNFVLDFSPNESNLRKNFNFGLVVGQLVEVAHRKVDLFTLPVFIMDFMVVEPDLTVAYKESGVCFLSHRADFETVLFDIKLLIDNYPLFLEYLCCFLSLWFGFFLFSLLEKGASFDQAGKDLLNTIRNALSITLHKPPRHSKIRILLLASIWGFFIVNYVTQAAIISFFTAVKRGKEVETFDDIIEKGYPIKGMTSPDVLLPETEERFITINSRLVGTTDLMDCVRQLANDSHLFCLIECSTARYFERNELNANGQQYMHVMRDRVHSRYLSMLLQRHSPMTPHVNKYLLALVEAGLVEKWEQYRYNDIKEDVPVKPLAFSDLIGIFELYGVMTALSACVFVLEVATGNYSRVKRNLKEWNRLRNVKKVLKREKKLMKTKLSNVATQT